MSVVSDKDVVESIVIVVADRNSRGPAGTCEACFDGDIGERPITIVLVQTIRSIGGNVFQASAAKKKQIHPTVVVVIDERHAASNHFNDVVLSVYSAIDSRMGQASLFCDIGKARWKRAAGGFAARLSLDASGCNALAENGWYS